LGLAWECSRAEPKIGSLAEFFDFVLDVGGIRLPTILLDRKYHSDIISIGD